MTTVKILISKDDLKRIFGNSWTHSNLNDYIIYKVKPYLNLHVFSYYEFENLQSPIDGNIAPIVLQHEINSLARKQLLQIKVYRAKLLGFNSLEELCESIDGVKLLEILAGRFTEKSIFYNTITQSSYINAATIRLINTFPEKYILAQINIHK